jgi:hypothetical protein
MFTEILREKIEVALQSYCSEKIKNFVWDNYFILLPALIIGIISLISILNRLFPGVMIFLYRRKDFPLGILNLIIALAWFYDIIIEPIQLNQQITYSSLPNKLDIYGSIKFIGSLISELKFLIIKPINSIQLSIVSGIFSSSLCFLHFFRVRDMKIFGAVVYSIGMIVTFNLHELSSQRFPYPFQDPSLTLDSDSSLHTFQKTSVSNYIIFTVYILVIQVLFYVSLTAMIQITGLGVLNISILHKIGLILTKTFRIIHEFSFYLRRQFFILLDKLYDMLLYLRLLYELRFRPYVTMFYDNFILLLGKYLIAVLKLAIKLIVSVANCMEVIIVFIWQKFVKPLLIILKDIIVTILKSAWQIFTHIVKFVSYCAHESKTKILIPTFNFITASIVFLRKKAIILADFLYSEVIIPTAVKFKNLIVKVIKEEVIPAVIYSMNKLTQFYNEVFIPFRNRSIEFGLLLYRKAIAFALYVYTTGVLPWSDHFEIFLNHIIFYARRCYEQLLGVLFHHVFTRCPLRSYQLFIKAVSLRNISIILIVILMAIIKLRYQALM